MFSRPCKPACDLEQKQFKLDSASFRLETFATWLRMPRVSPIKPRTLDALIDNSEHLKELNTACIAETIAVLGYDGRCKSAPANSVGRHKLRSRQCQCLVIKQTAVAHRGV